VIVSGSGQGRQMVSFQTKNAYLGIFWRTSKWKMMLQILVIWNILRPLGIFKGHLVILYTFGIFFPRFGILCQEKSGNPGSGHSAVAENAMMPVVLANFNYEP
jgi:hypothetical protein